MLFPGRFIEIGVGKETTRNTALAAAARWVKHIEANILAKAQKVVDDTVRGQLEDADGGRIVRKWFEGDLGGILHVDVLGYILTNLYGAPTTTTVTGAVKQHVFNLVQGIDHPTLSLFKKDDDVEQKVYNGGVIKSLSISATTEDYVRFTAGIMAKGEASNASSPSYGTEYDFIGKDITIKLADTEAGLAGATALKVKEVNVAWDPGAVADYVLGSYAPDSVYNTKMAIDVEIVKNFEDTTFKDLFVADTYKYMQISIVGAADIGSTNYPTVTVLLQKAQVQEWERSGDPDALSEETVKIKAFFNATDAKQSTVTLKNLTAAY
jgi:hypothetical protein